MSSTAIISSPVDNSLTTASMAANPVENANPEWPFSSWAIRSSNAFLVGLLDLA